MPESHNDPTISDSERLWRRIHPVHIKMESGEPRPSSAAFRSKTDRISVAIASLTTPETVLANYPRHSLAEFGVGFARSTGCGVVRNPLPSDPAHALLNGTASRGHLTKSEARRIAGQARWVRLQQPQQSASE